ncbi:putative lipoprotein [Leptospira inadai serovar Lyme str. 10]|uniref:Lipoprotein n=2 Tax=Leptospira inadai serovar Lyme TaxID=293084 RepID=A0ABX4YDT3_9LEPT|nr:hypothetical protein [Leptospira inadai]EQA35660.1 putative lipoprotein [Leptospira inadai serovar Lyme str. 10]PNV72604.1 hypothetical protein BES34_019175 [Leptospira inadai serovar Lyme]
MSQKSFALLLLYLTIAACAKPDDDFYSFEESASKLLLAYGTKDRQCGSSRGITHLVPGRSRKKDVDNCILSVAAEQCSFWIEAGDPVPFTCKAIEYRLK